MSVRLVIAEDEHMRRMLADVPDFNGSRRWPRQGAGRRLCSLGDRRGPYVRSSMKLFCRCCSQARRVRPSAGSVYPSAGSDDPPAYLRPTDEFPG
jgi:hypothetical protein